MSQSALIPPAPAAAANSSKLLTVEEAAERLQVPSRDIIKAIEAGSLSYVRLGKHVRIHPQDLDDYCARHTIRAWSRP